jgi:transposase
VAGIGWPLPSEWTDEVLEQRLFSRAGVKPGRRRHTEPDWVALTRELKRSGVNLMVLWEEYRESYPDGYGYSRFCDLYREFERRLSPVMRQHHVAGDKVFVDYSGKKIAIVDPSTGEIRDAEIFVAVLGASNYTYAEATWTQKLSDWIEAHVRMFRFFDGVPRLIVPDNLKSGVHKASFYDPEINRSYAVMAAHYGVGILPARLRWIAGLALADDLRRWLEHAEELALGVCVAAEDTRSRLLHHLLDQRHHGFEPLAQAFIRDAVGHKLVLLQNYPD